MQNTFLCAVGLTRPFLREQWWMRQVSEIFSSHWSYYNGPPLWLHFTLITSLKAVSSHSGTLTYTYDFWRSTVKSLISNYVIHGWHGDHSAHKTTTVSNFSKSTGKIEVLFLNGPFFPFDIEEYHLPGSINLIWNHQSNIKLVLSFPLFSCARDLMIGWSQRLWALTFPA